MNTITLNETAKNPSSIKESFIPSVITGQVAGLIMAVAVMGVFSIIYGKNPLYPVQVIGSLVLGEQALNEFNIPAILIGLILHQAGPSLLWGSIFGLVANKFDLTSTKSSLIAGLITGVISMVGPYLLIPFLFHNLQGVDIWNREVPLFWDWVAHLIFGLSFVLYPWIQKKIKK